MSSTVIKSAPKPGLPRPFGASNVKHYDTHIIDHTLHLLQKRWEK